PWPGEAYRGREYRAAVLAPTPGEPRLHLDPWRPPRLYRACVALLRRLLPLLFRLRVTGLENLPRPPYIVASNHLAWYDAVFLLAALPPVPMMHSMARRQTVFDRRWKRLLLPRLGVFPISPDQGELDPEGVRAVYRVLSAGGVVMMFPEGGYERGRDHSRGRDLLPLKKGIGHFALEAGVPVVPVALAGVDRLKFRSLVEVAVGPPVRARPPLWWSTQRRVVGTVAAVRQAILDAFGRHGTPPPPGG
ncbi:MAG: lysophospholipid acyltransferase family protein, partial [Candidatus Dormibacterales bacterium]